MKSENKFLVSVLRDAQRPGRMLAPSRLLKAVRCKKYPIRALIDFDKSNALFKEFDDEFEFIKYTRVTGKLQSDQDYEKWVALIRWVISELRLWRMRNDPKCHTLTTIFIVTHSCDWDGTFWNFFPENIGKNLNLINVLQKATAAFRVEFNAKSIVAPIWEIERLDKFKLADAQLNWVEIIEIWRNLDHAVIPNIFQIQAIRILNTFAFKHLVLSVKNFKQTPVAMQIAWALSIEQRMVLAIASDNPYINFSCVYTTLTEWNRQIQLPSRAQRLLKRLLIKIAKDNAKWKAWMRVFNYYPMRYPALQASLGYALAVVPVAAIETYISSIDLSVSLGENRLCVAECLRCFRKVAIFKRRQKLWTLAYKRWFEWRFDKKNDATFLFEIKHTTLDYAVVGYIIECMDKAGCDQALIEIQKNLGSLDKRWYESISSCITEYYRLLSMFQPYANAKSIIGKDWFLGTMIYQPFKELYLPMKFSL